MAHREDGSVQLHRKAQERYYLPLDWVDQVGEVDHLFLSGYENTIVQLGLASSGVQLFTVDPRLTLSPNPTVVLLFSMKGLY